GFRRACNGRRPVVECPERTSKGGKAMIRRYVAIAGLALVAAFGGPGRAAAQETLKIGLVMPMTGALANPGREVVDGAKLYMAQHGDVVAGKKIQLIVKD